METLLRPTRLASALAVAVGLGLLLPTQARAQQETITACYVPDVGAVYLIGEQGLPSACLEDSHVEVSWSEGVGVTDHGELEGLDDDDHAQYVREGESASGDLGGSYPDPGVVGLQGNDVGDVDPSDGEFLGWNGSANEWVPMSAPSGGGGVTEHDQLSGLQDDDHDQVYLHLDGRRAMTGDLSMGGNKIEDLDQATSSGEAVRFEQAVLDGDAASGDLGGSFPDPDVVGLQGTDVSSSGPSDGDVLTYDAGANQWEPASVSGGGGGHNHSHSNLNDLDNDDHTQYLLAEGVRQVTDGFAVSGTVGSGSIATSGAGTRMMWHPAKAAFRAGQVDGSQWDDGNIGEHSVAFGRSTVASAAYAVAMGVQTEANSAASMAMGTQTEAGGSSSTAMGLQTEAAGSHSTAMGHQTTASGGNSTAMGFQTTANADQATAMGFQTTASGENSMAIGENNEASGENSLALGSGATAGAFSAVAMGCAAEAQHAGTFVWSDNLRGALGGNCFGNRSTEPNQFLIQAENGVGIGTNDPGVQFVVSDEKAENAANPSANIVLFENRLQQSGTDVLGLVAGPSPPGNGVNYVTFYDRNNTARGAIEGTGQGGVTLNTSSNDFAEMLPRRRPSESIEAGDVVGIVDGEVTKTINGADQVSVVTDRAVVLGNDPGPAERADYEKVSFVGQVPVKTRGPVEKGDLLVASGRDDGTARAVEPSEFEPQADGPVVGQAWESASGGTERVNALIGSAAETAALRSMTERQQDRIQEQAARIDDQRKLIEKQRDRIQDQSERLDRLEATVERLVESETSENNDEDGGSRQ